MLSVARVAGETAPLLFTALGNRFWSMKLTEPIATLPVQIYTYAITNNGAVDLTALALSDSRLGVLGTTTGCGASDTQRPSGVLASGMYLFISLMATGSNREDGIMPSGNGARVIGSTGFFGEAEKSPLRSSAVAGRAVANNKACRTLVP